MIFHKRKTDEHSAEYTLTKYFFNKTFSNQNRSLKDIYSMRRSGLLNEMRKIKYERS